MPTLDVRDRSNKVIGSVEVGASVFERPIKRSVLHEAVVNYQAAQRRGTHSSKTRAEVRGSKRKPWRQKGSGRARAGDRRSPIWRKGGTTFGPQMRDHSTILPRRKMRIALRMALSSKCAEGQIVVLDEMALDAPRTKLMASLLAGLELGGRTLIYDPDSNEGFALAARNLPNAKVVGGFGLNVYDLLLHETLLTTKAGICQIDEALR
jgi:large subunit ribosomal protein L4